MSGEQEALPPPGARGGAAGAEPELPGDPVCLLRRVCQECGGVADEDPPTICPHCHAELTAG